MLMQSAICVALSSLFDLVEAPLLQVAAGSRTRLEQAIFEVLLDRFPKAQCAFVRFSGNGGTVTLTAPGTWRIEACPAGGWLLADTNNTGYWLPRELLARTHDGQGHILSEQAVPLEGLFLDESEARLAFKVEAGTTVEAVVWRIDDPTLMQELMVLSVIERQRWFLLGSHTAYARPADIYRHLINGRVYDDRYAWPHRRRICSENDAHALHLVLSGIGRATGKRIYELLSEQIVLCVLARQGEDGGFRHGEWTDDMEPHFRLNASAMHLFLDRLAAAPDATVEGAADRLAEYLSHQRDDMAAGIWFYHDGLELSSTAMSKAPFAWAESRAFGKSPSNMLVLNTHLDVTIALDRYARTTGNLSFAPLVDSARRAAHAVLAHRPAERLYRLVFSALNLTQLPAERAARLPLWQRAWKRVGWKYLAPRLHRLKARFPRLVMPGGYIDRAGPLQGFAFDYLPVNLMDLVRWRGRFGNDLPADALENGLRFAQESGVRGRYAELRYERYALGFWAECLILLCVQDDAPRYRAWLAEAVLDLEDLALGLPPSLLGANAEAVSPRLQFPCPSPANPRVRIANLSGPRGVEFLAVNTTQDPLSLEWDIPPAQELCWISGDTLLPAEAPFTIPSRGSLRGVAKRASA